jgi:tetratricopeptide (TPR) repeat protein
MHIVDKPITERSRTEIDAKIRGMGEYMKMSYLQRAAKSQLDYDTRRFVLLELTKLYEQKGMFLDASKTIRAAADITTTFKDKIAQFMKSVEYSIRGSSFSEAERLFQQALALGNDREKFEMKQAYKRYHYAQAQAYLKADRRNNAKEVLQKMLTLDLTSEEKGKVQNTLLDLYYKLGNVREYHALKDKMAGGTGNLGNLGK